MTMNTDRDGSFMQELLRSAHVRPEVCSFCRFFHIPAALSDSDASVDGTTGECRRRAPVLDPDATTRWWLGAFPLVPLTGWCGEFDARPRKAPSGEGPAEGG